jgi:hypothetical protein
VSLRTLCVAAGLFVLGCDANRASTEAQLVAQLCRLEERLRSAPNPAKAELLAALAKAPCPTPAACAARDACTSGYALHVEALKLTAVAKQNISDGQGEQAAKLLGAAEEKLKGASSRIDTCTAAMAALRRQESR